jgi:hypothetical protein
MLLTDRFALPLLAAGQSQKEVTHNEAVALIDILTHPSVVSIAVTTAPAAPMLGQCWIVGVAASGAWAGHDGDLVCWTAGGWRFVKPTEGMEVWSVAESVTVRRQGGAWVVGVENVNQLTVDSIKVVGKQQAGIAAPTNGLTVDSEARAAITAILGALRGHGLIAS